VLLVLLERWLRAQQAPRLLDRELAGVTAKIVLASLAMSLALWLFAVGALPLAAGAGSLAALLTLGIVLAGAVYVALLEALGLRDARVVWGLARERLRPAPNPPPPSPRGKGEM
jgi:peptidoglycan biosynthesis protein MviN/MurJ (putative lipid II flippase)